MHLEPTTAVVSLTVNSSPAVLSLWLRLNEEFEAAVPKVATRRQVFT